MGLNKQINVLSDENKDYQDKLKELESKENDNSSLNEQIEMWKSKYEELMESVSPFKEQLDAFAAEKDFLLNSKNMAHQEVDDLNKKYAQLMGHQNQKQKIRHVVKLKEENYKLKQENVKLKSQVDSLKKKVATTPRKSKFDPRRAFSKGSTGESGGKENKNPKELSS